MSFLKKLGIAVGAGVLALAGGGFGLWYYLGHTGPTRLEQWIGRQIVTVVEGYVTPRIDFKTLQYQAPRTVIIDGLKFTAEDRPILSLDRIVLELAQVPRVGQPILIQRVEATRPQLQFVSDRAGGMVGWSHFVRPGVRRNPPPPGRRFSDILVLRNVAINDGQVVYDASDGSPPMTLPGIDLKLNTPKLENQPGWYQLAGVLERAPIFHMDVDGKINLDTGLLDLANCDLKAAIGPEQYSTLPPQAQQFLSQHQVQGMLAVNVQGQIPLDNPAKSAGLVRADLQSARFAYAGLTVPADRIQFEARMPEGPVNLNIAGVALAAADHSFFSLKKLALAVARIPTSGRPVEIDKLDIEGPRVAFVRDPVGGFVGWNQLKAAAPSSSSASTQPAADIARAVVLKQLDIRDAGLAYAADPTTRPAGIEGIDLALHTQPQSDGSYQVDGTLKREPLITGQIAARADLAAGVIDVQKMTASGSLSEKDYAALPPQAVSLLRQYGVHGQFTATADGRVALHSPADSAGRAEVELKDAAFNYGGVKFPLKHARLAADLPKGGIKVAAEGLALESPDVSLLSIDKAEVDLASLPQQGRPMQLQRVALDHPRFRFVRAEGGELVGWSRLIDKVRSTSSTGSGPEVVSGPGVVLQQLLVTKAAALYQSPGQSPIAIEDVNLDASAIPTDSGAYATKGRLTRDQLLDMKWDGRLDPQSLVLDLADARLTSRLERRDYDAFPQAMRATLESYGLLGQFDASWRGRIPLKNPGAAAGEVNVDVKDGRAIYKGVTFEATRLRGGGKLPDGQLLTTAEGFSMRRGDRRLLSTRGATLELPLPRAGQPMRVTRLELDRPNGSLVERKDGTYVGWSELAGSPGPRPRDGGGAQKTGEGQRASSAPAIQSLRIRDGQFSYRPADAPRMLLTGIELNASARLRDEQVEVYILGGSLHGEDERGDMRFEGRLWPADWLLELDSFTGRTALDERHAAMLPPAVQKFVRDHQMRGQLDVRGQARVPLTNTDRATAEWRAEFRSGRLAVGSSIWPIDQLTTTGKLADSRLRADFNASLLGGSGNGSVEYTLTGSQPLQLSWSANGLQLERTLQAASGQASNYSGSLSSTGRLSARGAAVERTLSGNGSLSISNGQLVNVPIIHEILAVASAANLGRVLNLGRERRADTAQVSFELRPDAIQITQGEVNSPVIKLTGSGRVGYDSTLDLRVRANVLQQAQRLERELTGTGGLLGRAIGGRGAGRIIGQTIGPAGQAVGRLADQIVTYRVTGTTSSPRVVPEPLGGLGR